MMNIAQARGDQIWALGNVVQPLQRRPHRLPVLLCAVDAAVAAGERRAPSSPPWRTWAPSCCKYDSSAGGTLEKCSAAYFQSAADGLFYTCEVDGSSDDFKCVKADDGKACSGPAIAASLTADAATAEAFAAAAEAFAAAAEAAAAALTAAAALVAAAAAAQPPSPTSPPSPPFAPSVVCTNAILAESGHFCALNSRHRQDGEARRPAIVPCGPTMRRLRPAKRHSAPPCRIAFRRRSMRHPSGYSRRQRRNSIYRV